MAPGPIIDRFLEPNFLMALEFGDGFVFTRVIRTQQMRYKPYSVIDSNGNTVDIAADSHQSELRLRDPRNTENDILFLDSAQRDGYPTLLHGSIGIRPGHVKMYPRIPEGQTIPGKFPNIDPISPSNGDDIGYISTERSSYEHPSDWYEWVIPPRTHVGVEFYNNDPDRAHNPVLNVLFNLYYFDILDPESSRDARLIRSIAARQVPASFLTVGAPDNPIRLTGTTRNAWNIDAITLDNALTLGGT